jgi:hypothetical protein
MPGNIEVIHTAGRDLSVNLPYVPTKVRHGAYILE